MNNKQVNQTALGLRFGGFVVSEEEVMTNEEKKRIYAALAAPFPEACVQRTEGRVTGRGYDTTGIGYQHIANRLNEVVGLGNWRAHRTVTVKEITTAKGRQAYEAICDITLELGEWIDGQFSVFAESLSDGGHVAMSQADARKGSYTNSFKKAAAFFGCGWQAFAGMLDDDNLPADHAHEVPPPASVSHYAPPAPGAVVPLRPNQQRSNASTQPTQAVSTQANTTPDRNRMSSKQAAAIWAIGRKLGHNQQSLRAEVKTRYGKAVDFLSREEASDLINFLSNQAATGQVMQAGQGG